MKLPIIGITTSVNDDEQRLDIAYVSAVEKAGGLPIIVPVFGDKTNVRAFATMLDGLIISGGPAIETNLIGSLPDDINATDKRRVQNDGWILEAFLDSKKPILGICYGMQLINAHFGGTIYADVQAALGLDLAHTKKRGRDEHGLVTESGTHVNRILQNGRAGAVSRESVNSNVTTPEAITHVANSRHIQAIATAGSGLTISARAEDGVIEAVESADGRLIGVQFHPEAMGLVGAPFFKNLIRDTLSRLE